MYRHYIIDVEMYIYVGRYVGRYIDICRSIDNYIDRHKNREIDIQIN